MKDAIESIIAIALFAGCAIMMIVLTVQAFDSELWFLVAICFLSSVWFLLRAVDEITDVG